MSNTVVAICKWWWQRQLKNSTENDNNKAKANKYINAIFAHHATQEQIALCATKSTWPMVDSCMASNYHTISSMCHVNAFFATHIAAKWQVDWVTTLLARYAIFMRRKWSSSASELAKWCWAVASKERVVRQLQLIVASIVVGRKDACCWQFSLLLLHAASSCYCLLQVATSICQLIVLTIAFCCKYMWHVLYSSVWQATFFLSALHAAYNKTFGGM